MALAKKSDTIFQTDSGRVYPGIKVEALSGGTPVQLYRDAVGTPASQIVSDSNGLYTFWVNEGTYTLRYSLGGTVAGIEADVAIYNLVRKVELASDNGAEGVGVSSGDTLQDFLDEIDQTSGQKANASAIGIAGTAENMGTFAGSVIPDNQSAKQALQSLESGLETLNQPNDGRFWTAWNTVDFPPPPLLDAKVQRLNRLLVGAARATSGDFPATNKDYYEQFEADHTSEFGFRTSWAELASGSTVGGIGVLGFSRTSDTAIDIPFQLGVGGWFGTINDNLDNPCLATGLYGVAFRMPGAGQGITGVGTVGGEVDICNLGNSVQVTPGNLYPTTGFTTAWQINSGAYVDEAVTASAAITIGNNKADFFAGVVIGANALAGINRDGNGRPISGGGSAFRLPAFSHMEWWTYPWTTASFLITSRQLTEANFQSIVVKDTGIEIGGAPSTGLALQTIYPGGATGAWIAVAPSYGVNAAAIYPSGQTNADLDIKGAGTGALQIRSPSGSARITAATVGLAFFGSAPIAKPTITGSRGGNAALADLLTKLASYGLLIDGTS